MGLRYTDEAAIVAPLKKADARLAVGTPPIEVLIVGYSAIVMASPNTRGSEDVHSIPSRFSRMFAQEGLEVFSEHYFYFPRDFRKRLHPVAAQFHYLKVYYADAHDIWFAKLAAFRSKDKVDLRAMVRDNLVDPKRLDTLFPAWNDYRFNGSAELAANYAEVRGAQ